MTTWTWIIAAGVLLGVEILTADLLFASLGLSALAAGVASWAGASTEVSIATFVIVAVLSIALLRPIALRHLRKTPADAATGIDALIGSTALVTEEITENSGLIKLSGEIWTARARGENIQPGTHVKVVSIDGAIAIVREDHNHG